MLPDPPTRAECLMRGFHTGRTSVLSRTGNVREVKLKTTWEFPKIRGTFLGVPILRIIVYWGLYWGTLILGKYHILLMGAPLHALDDVLIPELLQVLGSCKVASFNSGVYWG